MDDGRNACVETVMVSLQAQFLLGNVDVASNWFDAVASISEAANQLFPRF